MARKNTFSLPKSYLVGGGAILFLGIVALTVSASLHQQLFQQHASVSTFTSLAVQGSIYIDTNRNGTKDSGEQNYTGSDTPKVTAALFDQTCEATPPISSPPDTSPMPTPPPGCYYRTICKQIACRSNEDCGCTPVLYCPPSFFPGPSVAMTGTPIEGQAVATGTFGNWNNGSQNGNSNNNNNGNQGNRANRSNGKNGTGQSDTNPCDGTPIQKIDCPVASDGTYSCLGNNLPPYVQALVFLDPPSGYTTTSVNPAKVNPPTDTIDFGINKVHFPPFENGGDGGVGNMNNNTHYFK